MEPLVAPFRGERYSHAEMMEQLIAPPYDVISPEMRETLASEPANVVNVTLPVGDDPHAAAAAILAGWRKEGILKRDDTPSVYVLRQTYEVGDKTFARTGVIAAVAAEPYTEGRVLPHEKTHAHVKEDRLALLRATDTMCESLFFHAPDDDGQLRNLLQNVTDGPPDTTTSLGDVRVELWCASGDIGQNIASAAGRSHIYIADGHHRFETGCAYREENPAAARTLALIVPLGDPGLVVLPTHRIVSGNEIDRATVVKTLGDRFVVTETDDLTKAYEMLVSLDKTACVVALANGPALICELKPDADLADFRRQTDARTADLDIARIDSLVVNPLKGTCAGTVSYSADLDAVQQALADGSPAAVIVRPTGVEQVVAIADAGGVMPQKATYFVPKVPSGLVFLDLSN